MRYVDEYRDAGAVAALARQIETIATRRWKIMEVCGGQTGTIVKYGLDTLLPEPVTLVHGPGCPVCVTPVAAIDSAVEIAMRTEVVFCSFGDMLRVPGSSADLLSARASGADVRIVYSPMDALALAAANPDREVVFFAVGFETTAPANAMAVYQAHRKGIDNFSMLVSQVLIPPAMAAILASPGNTVRGFLAAGHVCTVMGLREYRELSASFGVPIVVTGFEPVDIMQGVLLCVAQLEAGRAEVENQYSRSVRPAGNRHAQEIIEHVFEIEPRVWRGIGKIPGSGLGLRGRFARFDARRRFGVTEKARADAGPCISGLILQGARKPDECPAFAGECTPHHPLGATMVSSEGACSIYYRYRNAPPSRERSTDTDAGAPAGGGKE